MAFSLILNLGLGYLLFHARTETVRAGFTEHQFNNAYFNFVIQKYSTFDAGVHELWWITSYKRESDQIIKDPSLRSVVNASYIRTADQIISRLSSMTNESFGRDLQKWLDKYCPELETDKQ